MLRDLWESGHQGDVIHLVVVGIMVAGVILAVLAEAVAFVLGGIALVLEPVWRPIVHMLRKRDKLYDPVSRTRFQAEWEYRIYLRNRLNHEVQLEYERRVQNRRLASGAARSEQIERSEIRKAIIQELLSEGHGVIPPEWLDEGAKVDD